ncbi:apolipoprotein N-acyltransferase [Oleispirillum naphthae]|uniref:apolipoprotein N-acyltransferase n=1 Tax=Oleispirillum naphthae TaxID=2838853 RepID=UPI0030825D6C
MTARRAAALAALAGVAAAAALPPLSALPLLPLCLSGLYLLWAAADARPRPARRRFLVGWAFGAGYFAAGLYWVAEAFLVDAATYGWMIPFALGGLGVGLGLFPGAALWLAGFAPARPLARWAGFAAAWVLAEWLRGWVLTGFPWNALGIVWAPLPAFAQAAAAIGMYGLSWLVALAATAPAAGRLAAFGAARGVLRGCGVLALIVAVQGLAGWARLPAGPAPAHAHAALRLVQPNIPQTEKWRSALRRENLLQHVLLSRRPGWESRTLVVWPETASTFPLDLPQDALARNLAAQAAPPGGWLIAGAPRRTPPGEPFRLWNSVIALSAAGEIGDIHDKAHLVPFGEYVPGHGWLPIAKLAAGRVDYSPGPGLRTVHLSGAPPYSPLVCYEIVFPGAVADPKDRPEWLLNVTNDAWFGLSAGPHQHLAAAALRAVEEGLPVARAANTGISAVIDPYGRIVARLALGSRGVIDAELPRALPETPFSRLGNGVPLALAAMGFLAACLAARYGLHRRRATPTS